MKILNAIIRSWLWSNYNKAFESSYKIPGQDHIDPHCSWLIDATVEVVIRYLISNCSKLQDHLTSIAQSSENKLEYDELNRQLAVHASRALAHGIYCNEEMVSTTYHFFHSHTFATFRPNLTFTTGLHFAKF